ncbi:MAG: hypothetical protein WCI05_08540 [Myxococcales bacterium]|jgi:uncharacterized protein YegL
MIPGEALAKRPLHFIWIVDRSGSMNNDGKIQALNTAIAEALPHVREIAKDNPNAEILMRVLSFSSGARWEVSQPTPVDAFVWKPIVADGLTDMGKAFSMVADQLHVPPMSGRALPPVLVLLTDGEASDDWQGGLRKLLGEPWGIKAVRLAIAIGHDCTVDVLKQFIRNVERPVMQANNPEALTKFIRFVSTEVIKSASSPASQPIDRAMSGNVPVGPPPAVSDDAVW